MPTPVRVVFEGELKPILRKLVGTLLNIGGGSMSYREWTPAEMVNLDLMPGPDVDVVADLSRELPFVDCSFDHVLCTSVLEHVSQPEQVVSEIRRVLKPGGRLVLYVPYLFPVHPDPRDYWRFSPDGLDVLCSDLKPVKRIAVGGPFLLIANILYLKLSQRLPHRLRHKWGRLMGSLAVRLDSMSRDADRWASGWLWVLDKVRRTG